MNWKCNWNGNGNEMEVKEGKLGGQRGGDNRRFLCLSIRGNSHGKKSINYLKKDENIGSIVKSHCC